MPECVTAYSAVNISGPESPDDFEEKDPDR